MLVSSLASGSLEAQKLKGKEASKKALSEFRALYNELQSFKDTDAFKKYGLATAGPYNDWLKRVKGFENKYDGNILLDRGIFIGDLGSLGYHYVGSKGKETAVTQSLNKILLDGLSKKESANEGPVAVAGSGLKNYEEIKRKYQLFGKWTITNSILKANGYQNTYTFEIYKNGNRYVGVMAQKDMEYQTEILEKRGGDYFVIGNSVSSQHGEYYRIDADMNMTLFDRDGDLATAGYTAVRKQ